MVTKTQLTKAEFTSLNLAAASFALVVYDHIITFADEVTFFWSGSWSTSRILYLSIRYLALIQVFFVYYANINIAESGSPLLSRVFILSYILAFMVMLLCQCVVTLRVWYLFHRNPFIKWLAVIVFIASMAGTVIIGSIRFGYVKVAYEINTNDPSQSPPAVFMIYLPSLIVHTIMFSLTMYRFRVSSLQGHQIIHRFLKEGIFMYAFAAGTLVYEIISLSLTQPQDITIYYSALGGGIAVGTTVVSVCRAMLSIRSLAATYHVDPSWLLSHAEISRVQWRRGVTEGEIYVEVNELDVVLPTTSLTEEGGVQKCT